MAADRPPARDRRPVASAAGASPRSRWSGFVYLFIPIVVIVAFSFNKPDGKFNIIWQEFTLDNWKHPFAAGPLTDAMVLLAARSRPSRRSSPRSSARSSRSPSCATGSGAARSSACCSCCRSPRPRSCWARRWPRCSSTAAWQRGFGTIVIAHILFCTSFVALTVKARIRGFDWTLEDAAMDLGAPPWRTFSRVTLPLITPGILAAGAALLRPVDRRLHHHVLQLGLRRRRSRCGSSARPAPSSRRRSTCWPRSILRRQRGA